MYRNGLPGGAATTKESEAEVQKIIDADGRDWDTSLARLTKADPIYAPTLCRNDWYRLKRALVIVHSTGKPVSYFKKNENITRSEQDYDFRCFFLTQPRLDFCLKSDARCEEIVDRGLIEETAKIYGMGLLYEHTVGSAIGYKQAIQYLNAEWLTPLKISRQRKSRRLLKFISDYQATVRRYARTQMGYHNKDTQFMWLDASEPDVQVREEQLITSIKQLYESTEADYESALAENAEFRTASYQITPKEEKLMKRWIPENTLYNTPQHIEAKLESIEAALIVHKMLEVEEKTTDDEKTPVVLSKRAKNRSLEGR
ncbi:hypothetical protein SARC_12452 [Sphaeroforma arctica JP610]|uniref:Uncharacterized protein n=1 Tax=Sphaeroforma arctica JP610 TaxID=667725 RepID=A0A0L0FE28_9EUKA|nr:hypothetical protein SARC_12452 [Sphaeroforma arctica JP610]KNC75014.1 hypothetical protein SARC_12452 [Sphaeroforma arctica JP610]|eukprot:XP_014148916.1 hypothetical protein SARC_12452 [Sphaeroforma arctica JP610]